MSPTKSVTLSQKQTVMSKLKSMSDGIDLMDLFLDWYQSSQREQISVKLKRARRKSSGDEVSEKSKNRIVTQEELTEDNKKSDPGQNK